MTRSSSTETGGNEKYPTKVRGVGQELPVASQNGERVSRVTRRSPKTSEVIAQDIVHDIRNANLKPGDMLPPEMTMVQQYGVGRASVREALRLLEVNGLIRIKPGPGGGPVVGAANPADFGRMATLHLQSAGASLAELVEARVFIEPLLARLAAERQHVDGLDQLRAILENPLGGDDRTYLAGAYGFHVAVAYCSGNRVLDLFAVSIHEIFSERIHGAMYPVDVRNEVHREHLAIAKAIFAGDGRRAEKLMREHMEDFAKYVASRHPALLEEVIEWA